MGRQLLASPYETRWWDTSKYRLCLHRFDLLPRDARVLDLGCGLGQTAFFLAGEVAEVIGVDLSTFAIQFAKKNYQRPNLHFVQADIFQYHPGVPVDAVFCMDLIEHLEPQAVPKLLVRI
jgi:2-polyprenyl-3-methyl-5-hydroxy-6-metoxy-1,4-benzoquinol methylase